MKALIVDDEEKICNGIIKGIQWREIGIEEVFGAEDGIHAYEVFSRHLPDIVITDVRMPGIDGIELSRRIKEIAPNTKIVILSGYSEFEYARNAVGIGISEYELKPIKLLRLKEIIIKLIGQIETEKAALASQTEYMDTFKQRYLSDLLDGTIRSEREIFSKMHELFGFEATGELLVMCITIDRNQKFLDREQFYLLTAIFDVIEKEIRSQIGNNKYVICSVRDLTLISVLNLACWHTPLIHQKAEMLFKTMSDALMNAREISLSFGISNVGTASCVSTMMGQAFQALQCRLYSGAHSLHFFSEISPDMQKKAYFHVDMEGLAKGIKSNNFTIIYGVVDNFFQELKDRQCIDQESIWNCCFGFQNHLANMVSDMGVDFSLLYHNNQTLFDSLRKYDTIDDYSQWVKNIYKYVMERMSSSQGRYSAAILNAVSYINNNYQKDIGILTVAEICKKNPDYFSHIFRKEMGMSFIDYINKTRIQEAKRLLRETDEMIYQIGERVGYKNYVYFTQVFKKITNVSPSDYRKGIG